MALKSFSTVNPTIDIFGLLLVVLMEIRSLYIWKIALYSFESPKYLPVFTSLMKDADSVRAAVLIPFKLVKTFAFRPKMNLMKKFWTFSCRTKYIHSLLIGPKP